MFDVDRFIADCRAALSESSPEVATREVVERAVADPSAIERSLGTPHEGSIVALHRSQELTILSIAWTPGMAVFPHDHRTWAVIGLYGGCEDNTFYRRSPQGLVAAGGRQLRSKESVLLGRNVIHAVANPLTTFTCALHVYGGDFFAIPRSEWCPATGAERPFDVEQARRVFAEANARWASKEGGAFSETRATEIE